MSEVSLVDRVFDAAPELFFQEKYQHSLTTDPQYIHNPSEMEVNVRSLPEKRIQWLKDEGVFSTWSIDSVIQIKTPSNAFRRHQTSLWYKIYKINDALANSTLLAGGGFAMIETGISLRFRLTPAGTMITVGLTLITSGILGSFFYFRSVNAATQANLWNRSPVQELANQRAQAYKQGFPYVYDNRLKFEQEVSAHGILHPFEVKTMYEKYFSEFFKNLLNQEEYDNKGQERWMHDFLRMNPLSSHLMKYGLGGIPDHMRAVVDDYTRFNSMIHQTTQLLNYYSAARELLARVEVAWSSQAYQQSTFATTPCV